MGAGARSFGLDKRQQTTLTSWQRPTPKRGSLFASFLEALTLTGSTRPSMTISAGVRDEEIDDAQNGHYGKNTSYD